MERKITPHRLFPPVPERLREARLARGMTTIELAEVIGVTRQAVSQFELGHTTPSGIILAKIIEQLDLPLAFFTKPFQPKQKPFGVTFFRSLRSATKKSRETLTVKAGWLEDIYCFLQEYVTFPRVNLPDFSSKEALSKEDIEEIVVSVRKHWGLGLGPISNVTLLLEKNGVIVARDIAGESKTDACSQWRGDRPFIFLGADKDSAVRSRLDAAHELGHLVLHMWVDHVHLSDPKILKRIEEEAFSFAGAFLLPKETFIKEVMSTSLKHFETLKMRWKVSMAAMIKRCEELDILSEHQVTYLWKQMSWKKYKTREPLDDQILPENPNLLKQAIELLTKNNVKSAMEIVDAIKLTPKEIESLCNLPSGMLSSEGKVVYLKLKG